MVFTHSFLPHSTERLILRKFIDADIEQFLSYRQDPEIARYQSWSMFFYSEAKSFINEMQTLEFGIPGEWFQIAIAEKQDNLLVGDIGIQVYLENPTTVEIGFTLDRKAQGKGYAREAIRALIDFLFEFEGINQVIAITDARNQPSINLLTRLGMKLLHSLEVEFKGEWCIENTFTLKKEDCLL